MTLSLFFFVFITIVEAQFQDLYVGCFVDKSSRILPDMTIYQKNSIERCLATCKEKNAAYAGVEYGKECFCGDLMKNYPLRPDSECDMACSGNRNQKCGGSWRISVYRTNTIEKDLYVGCFVDKYSRILPDMTIYQKNSIARCLATCKEKNATYAGVEYGKECFCGDLMKNYPLRPDSECDMACSGNRNQKCGGSWRISVYRTNTVEIGTIEKDQYMGCFVDGHKRVLPIITFDRRNEIEKCIDTCLKREKLHAGLEHGHECFCGDELSHSTKRPETECNLDCPGNKEQKCGGSWRISVYITEPQKSNTTTTIPLDCLVSRWAQWSETFAFGDQVRRRIIRKPWNGGKPCPKLTDIRKTDKIPTPKKVAEHFGRQFVRPDPQYPRDIIVIIDSSGSIGKQLFDRALPDLAELVGYFCPEPDPFVPQNNSFYHRLGVIQFSTVTEDIFNLDRYNNLGAIKGAIRSIKYMKKKTCTDKAFDAAYRMITQDGGARLPAVAKKQVLILTDGMWNCDGDPVAASKRLQTVADVYGFMIGINSKVKRRKLEKVISEPLLNHLFAVKNFSKFNVVVRQLGKTIKRGPLQCKEFQKP